MNDRQHLCAYKLNPITFVCQCVDKSGRFMARINHIYSDVKKGALRVACDCRTPGPCFHTSVVQNYLIDETPLFPSPSLTPEAARIPSPNDHDKIWSVLLGRRRQCVSFNGTSYRCQSHGLGPCGHIQAPQRVNDQVAPGEACGGQEVEMPHLQKFHTEDVQPLVLVPFPDENDELVTLQRPRAPSWLLHDGGAKDVEEETMSHCLICASRLKYVSMKSVVTFKSARCILENEVAVVSCRMCNMIMKKDGTALGRVELIDESVFSEHLSMMVAGGCSFTAFSSHKRRMYEESSQSYKFVHRETLIAAFEYYVR